MKKPDENAPEEEASDYELKFLSELSSPSKPKPRQEPPRQEPRPPEEEKPEPDPDEQPDGTEADTGTTVTETEIDVGVELVRKVNPDEEIPAIPLVQNVPNCIVRSPADTGRPLAPGADFEVIEIRVLDDTWERPAALAPFGLQPIDLSTLNPSVRVNLRVEGDLADALLLINGMAVQVNDGVPIAFKPGEYWNSGFKKWQPGSTDPADNVRVEGLGVHHLRAIPRNGMEIQGRYHLYVSCGLSESGSAAVSRTMGHLADLMEDGKNLTTPAEIQAHQARVIAATQNVVSAWRDALANIEVRSRHNVHVPHPTHIAGACRFRVRAYPDDVAIQGNLGEVKADPHPQKLITYDVETSRFISTLVQPSFFVCSDVYPDNGPLTFDKDGLLRGQADELTHGYYPVAGAEDKEITYGVQAQGPLCRKIRRGETIMLETAGVPKEWEGKVGEYVWSMVSHPPDAVWTFNPAGPTTEMRTRLKVDRTGHYVARVDYTLDKPQHHCNQTYAIVDLHIIIDVEVGLMLQRVGNYPHAVATHLGRPFYRRRTLERQEGADLLLYPVGAPTFGRKQHFVLTVSPELRMSPELTARVYTAPDRSTYIDYTGPVSVAMPYGGAAIAEFTIECVEPMYSIHLMRIRYAGLLELPGHAVEVSVTPLGGEECPGEDTEEIPETEEGTGTMLDLYKVNLLLYEHDLGEAPGDALAMPVPGTDDMAVNLSNGNFHVAVPLFGWNGRGMSLECELHYNSFHAAQMEAVERMGRINGVPRHELQLEYARNLLGYGWAYTYGVHVIDYVLSEEGNRIRKRLELVGADGNHVQFEASPPLAGTFKPAGRGSLLQGEPIAGGSLVINEVLDPQGQLKGYEMTDLYGSRWKFDELGRVTEISSRASVKSGGALAPIRIDYQGSGLVIKDTVDRTLTASTASNGAINEFKDQDNRSWKLAPYIGSDELLGEIVWPRPIHHGDERHVFDYDPWYFMISVKNRRRFESLIRYSYADDSWGRANDVSRSTLSWKAQYLPVKRQASSIATADDCRAAKRRYTWDRDSLALLRSEVRRDRIETEQAILAEGWIIHSACAYFSEPGLGEGKLVRRYRDVYGIVHETSYKASPDGRGSLPEFTRVAGKVLYRYAWDPATNQIHEQTDANQLKTVSTYDAYGNLEKVTYPALAGQTQGSTDTWVYGADGRLQSHTGRDGRTTTYGFGGAGDPHGIGLATTETLAGAAWEYAYYRGGMLKSTKEPFNGGITEYNYDVLDRRETVKYPEGEVVSGADETTAAADNELWTFIYDENGNLRARQSPLGSGESFTYDDHDREKTHTTSDGTEYSDQYEGFEEAIERRDRRGKTWKTERDHVGRDFLIIHPATPAGTLAERIVHPDDGNGNVLLYLCGPYDAAQKKIGYPRRVARTVYDWQGNVLQRTRWTADSATEKSPDTVWTYERDQYGHLLSLAIKYDGREKYKETYGFDNWFRVRTVTVGSATTEYELGPYGETLSVTAPDHGGSGPAKWEFGYDNYRRETTVKDPYGTVIRDIKYHPATATQKARWEYFGIRLDSFVPNRSIHRSLPPSLVLLKTVTFDKRGLAVKEKAAGHPETNLFYDLRGELVVRKQGSERVSYELDGRGRRRTVTMQDRITTTRTARLFDEAGNLRFLSGAAFNSVYEYDALDQLQQELRIPIGGVPQLFRTVKYDIFGRPVERTTEGAIRTTITYSNRGLSLSYRTTGGPNPATGDVSYWWNGQVRRFSRDAAIGPEYRLETTEPDQYGRTRKFSSTYFRLKGEVEYDYYPAGTRRSLTVRWGEGSSAGSIRRTYEYHPDWALKKIVVSPTQSYEFMYQPSGGMSGWKTPRGHVNEISYALHGGITNFQARRSSGGAKFLNFTTAFHPESNANAGKENETDVELVHATGDESPSSGSTRYHSTVHYDSKGRPDGFSRTRRGVGEVIERSASTGFASDGTVSAISEGHRFPARLLDRFDVDKSFTKAGRRHAARSTTDSIDGTVISAHRNTQITDRDAWGRATFLASESILSPETIASFFVDRRKLFRSEYSVQRDELGRVDGYVLTPYNSEPASPPVWTPTGVTTDVRFSHGPYGDIVAFRQKTNAPIRADQPQGLKADTWEYRLLLRDGNEIVAEIGRRATEVSTEPNDRLVRYYELGPGAGFRLAVRHRRRIPATGPLEYRTDEYLYGPGMSSVGLIGAPNDGSAGVSAVVRRFPIWDMPQPGDDRRERVPMGDSKDAAVLTQGSALYVREAEIARAGLPPGISSTGASALGSGLGVSPGEETFGVVLPHSGLFEDVHAPEIEVLDPQELPDLPDNSIGGAIERIIEGIILLTPVVGTTYRLNKSKVLVKEGLWDQARAEVTQATFEIATPVIFGAAGQLSGLIGKVARFGLGAYSVGTIVTSLPDLLMTLGGQDPETGASLSWDQRFLAASNVVAPQLFRGVPVLYGGYGCFAAGTSVWAEDGPRAIETLSPGDLVLAPSEEGTALRPRRVLDIHRHMAPTLRIEIGAETLEASLSQPFRVAGKGWLPAGELRPGERVVGAGGGEMVIRSIRPAQDLVAVFNLSVEHDKMYLVGSQRVVVHNKPEPIRNQVAKLRAFRALPNGANWTPIHASPRFRILQADVPLPGGKPGTIRLYKIETWPKDSHSPSQTAEFFSKGARYSAHSPAMRLAHTTKTQRSKNNTGKLRDAMKVQEGVSDKQLAAMVGKKHIDHPWDMCGGGPDVPRSMKEFEAMSKAGGIKWNFGLAPLDPSVNSGWGSIANHAHKRINRQPGAANAILLGMDVVPK